MKLKHFFLTLGIALALLAITSAGCGSESPTTCSLANGIEKFTGSNTKYYNRLSTWGAGPQIKLTKLNSSQAKLTFSNAPSQYVTVNYGINENLDGNIAALNLRGHQLIRLAVSADPANNCHLKLSHYEAITQGSSFGIEAEYNEIQNVSW
jgi:hypothetical protein